jgi:hypothetical protein
MRHSPKAPTLFFGALLALAAALPAGAETFYFTLPRQEPVFKCDAATGEVKELAIELPAELAARGPAEGGALPRRGSGRGRGGAMAMEIAALAADRQHIYWIDSMRGLLLRADSEGRNVESLLDLRRFQEGRAGFANGMTLHEGRLIWSNVKPGREIFSVGTDGQDPRLLVDVVATFGIRNQTPMSITVFDGRIYWIDPLQHGIFAAQLDGSDPAMLREAYGRGSLAVTAEGAYWLGSSLQIFRMPLDSTAEPQLILKNNRDIYQLAAHGGKLYWADAQGIHRANPDGSAAEQLCAKTGIGGAFAPVW